jgi:hypothetical protein
MRRAIEDSTTRLRVLNRVAGVLYPRRSSPRVPFVPEVPQIMSCGNHERRKEPRSVVCLTARWQGSSADVRIADLSEGGCYVDTIGEVITGESLTSFLSDRSYVWQGHVEPARFDE